MVITNHLHLITVLFDKIFVSRMESRDHECSSSSLDLLFTDDADESVLSRASIPTSGSFRSATSHTATFDDLPIEGKWKLSIAVSQPLLHPEEEYEGLLTGWEMIVDVKACNTHPRWERLATPPPTYLPLRLHTAVAVDNSIFVTGGFSSHRLDDLWRFDYDTNSWTELNREDRSRWPMHGQAAYLGEFGLLTFGGLASHGPQKQGHDVWLLDLFEDDWSNVPIAQDLSSLHEEDHFK